MRRLVAGLVAVLALAGCTAEVSSPRAEPSSLPSHDHGDARVSLAVGDGTERSEVGYTLADVVLPDRAGEPGPVSFRVDSFTGRPQTRFLREQTKRIHAYVVRDDLAVFRHVHPEMADDGTWRATLTLPEPGDYRLVAEFVARDGGGNGDHVMLGEQVTVPGQWQPETVPEPTGDAGDWGVEAEVAGDLVADQPQQLAVRLRRPDGAAPELGQYLGTSAHLTGFHAESGAAVHMHPLGPPVPAAEGDTLDLDFHAELPEPGVYVLFLQVRVDDFLHTLPIPVRAGLAS